MKHINLCAFLIILCDLTACGAQAVVHDVQTVKVPVRESCVEEVPTAPVLHTDAEIKAMSDYEAVITLLKERIDQAIYALQQAAVLEGCK